MLKYMLRGMAIAGIIIVIISLVFLAFILTEFTYGLSIVFCLLLLGAFVGAVVYHADNSDFWYE